MSQQATYTEVKGAGFFRRLGAWLYDLLVLTAIEMLAVGLIMAGFAIALSLGVSLEGYIDTSDFLSRHPIASPLFTVYIFAVAMFFYGYFWCKGGQTLGMRAWKLHMQNTDGSAISPTQAVIRMASSGFGAGNLFVFLSPTNQALQDMVAKCHVIKSDKL
ncbi:hypothetical protein CS022_23015 [Veronia nyctiphanis]|uniref:RDD domain-containing protein n=1 Tax=Veronia nyctiphanis TaxID=1278244 RepID=A0A4Q0YKP0_9GAMM|nr:RDD family protein [Veronia nyctiphanis]RXJ70554.1 hypothetical protein CS022_23015 [Veronia nyctiphanis]